ncbi:hypothetical protein AX14_008151 [Amanita brunnescens Koide BX004]|nr:hypothetical protein AX14_008151 [Amanita brunnescens Koide BX004]
MLSPQHLQDIIPTLFRAIAFCATPLSRLSIVARNNSPLTGRSQAHASTSSASNNWKRDAEERMTAFLSQLFTGPYAALSKLIQKVWAGPPETTPDISPPPPLFLIEPPLPSHSAELLSLTPHEVHPSPQALPHPSLARQQTQGQQILLGPATERKSSLTNSPIPTQPATPVPSLLSLPPPHVPVPMPTSPMASLVSPVLPSISVHLHSHPSSSAQQAQNTAIPANPSILLLPRSSRSTRVSVRSAHCAPASAGRSCRALRGPIFRARRAWGTPWAVCLRAWISSGRRWSGRGRV